MSDPNLSNSSSSDPFAANPNLVRESATDRQFPPAFTGAQAGAQANGKKCPFAGKSAHGTLTMAAAGLLVAGLLGGAAVERARAPSMSTLQVGESQSGTSEVSLQQANAIVQKLTGNQAIALKTFPGPDGLTGLVLKASGQPSVVGWITNSRSAFVIGGVIDANNNVNLTSKAMQQQLMPNGLPSNAAMSAITGNPVGVSGVTQGAGVQSPGGATAPAPAAAPTYDPKVAAATLGAYLQHPYDNRALRQAGLNGPHTLYMFFDPNCSYCHQAYEVIQQNLAALKKGGVSVQYIPVAFLKQTSLNMAVAIDQKGYSALKVNEDSFDMSSEQGGLQAPALPSDMAKMSAADAKSVQTVHNDTDMLQKLATVTGHPYASTPTFVWAASTGTPYIYPSSVDASHLKAIIASFQPGWKPEVAAKK